MPQLEGAYIRYAGSRHRYTYKLIYGVHRGELHWSAIVSRDGIEKGRPFGVVAVKLADAEALRMEAVDRVIEAIETLSGVAE